MRYLSVGLVALLFVSLLSTLPVLAAPPVIEGIDVCKPLSRPDMDKWAPPSLKRHYFARFTSMFAYGGKDGWLVTPWTKPKASDPVAVHVHLGSAGRVYNIFHVTVAEDRLWYWLNRSSSCLIPGVDFKDVTVIKSLSFDYKP